MHCTHVLRVEHAGVAVPAQSVSAVHCTHWDVVASQRGVPAGHCESVVQPAPQVYVPGRQMGAAVPQSELDRQATHRPVDTRHRGSLAGQSEFAAHWTHCEVSVLQTGAAAGQSVDVLQPTQAPALVHIGLVMGQGAVPPSAVQAAWQVCVPGQHTGVELVAHCALLLHCTH